MNNYHNSNMYFLQSFIQKMSTNNNATPVKEGLLLGIGNPLLDITVTDAGTPELLKKYDLLPNNAIIAEPKHLPLFDELVKEHDPMYLAGGATQNSIRVAQWLLQTSNATTFFGGVGNDVFKDLLKESAQEVGVNVQYEVHNEKATGKCGALITGEDRSLITDLGAAELFTADFLKNPEYWKYVETADFYYIGGFIVPVSSEAVLEVAKYAAKCGKTVIMNLHATFLCKYFADPNLDLMKYVDVLFGNGDEAAEFSKHQGFNADNISEMARCTANLPKYNQKRPRTVVFTQGKDPTVLAHQGEITQIDVVPVGKELIKDTNGCGDAFVGGYLSQLVQNKPITDCVRCGSYAAKSVIQYFGCNFPPEPSFE